MKGRVNLLSPKRFMAALMTDNNEYTSFEILGGFDVEIDDIISGDLESLGGETWPNETKHEHIEVFVEDIRGSREMASLVIS